MCQCRAITESDTTTADATPVAFSSYPPHSAYPLEKKLANLQSNHIPVDYTIRWYLHIKNKSLRVI